MTPLKPLENLRVSGVMATRYQLNKKCAQPECSEDAVDAHHCFPRSQIGNDFWFVEVEEWEETKFLHPLAHVTGLCRAHHDAVEAHAAWIKLEDGVWNWYDRGGFDAAMAGDPMYESGWTKIGPLNPQPGSREGKPKRKKFQGEARRQRKTVSVKVPNDEQENGAGLLDEQLELAGEILVKQGLYSEPPPTYYRLMAALIFFTTHVGFDA